MTLDFGMFPPEVNSARMYSGAGATSLTTAASAWNALAAELNSAALGYESVITQLSSEEWLGPASATMATAVTPYVAWMQTTAAQAEESATKANAAAAAFEQAFTSVVPPPTIAANRATLAQAVATNVLGQNTGIIAQLEALYGEMWAQDATAMYTYAAQSAAITKVTPYQNPPQVASQDAGTKQAASNASATATSAGTGQSTVSQLMTSVPGTLQSLAAPAAQTTGTGQSILQQLADNTTPLGFFWNDFGPDANIWNTIFSSGFYMPGNFMGTAADFINMGQQGATGAAGAAAGAAEGVAAATTAPLGGLGAAGNAVTAGLGNASLVGSLSVPSSWTGAGPSALSPALGATPMVAPPPAVAAGMPGVPMGGMGGRGFGRHVPPQYGFKPTFVTRPPSAG